MHFQGVCGAAVCMQILRLRYPGVSGHDLQIGAPSCSMLLALSSLQSSHPALAGIDHISDACCLDPMCEQVHGQVRLPAAQMCQGG